MKQPQPPVELDEEEFLELDEALNNLKLFNVHISYDDDVVVIAEDERHAEMIVEDMIACRTIDISTYDMNASARETVIKKENGNWNFMVPHGTYEHDEISDSIDGEQYSLADFKAWYAHKNKEDERLKEIAEKQTKLEL